MLLFMKDLSLTFEVEAFLIVWLWCTENDDFHKVIQGYFYLHKIYIHTWMYKRIYKLCWDLTVVFVLLWLWFISERRYSVQNLCVRGNAIDVQTWSDKNKCNGSIVFHSLKYNSSKTNLEHSCWLGHLFLFDLVYRLEVW